METYESRLVDACSLMKEAVLSDVLSGPALLGLGAAECELELIQREGDGTRCPALLALAEPKEPFNAEYQLKAAEMYLRAGLPARAEALAARAVDLDPERARTTFELLSSYGYEPDAIVNVLTATPEVLVAAHDVFLARGLSEAYLATVETQASAWTRPLLEAYGDVAFKERAFDRVIAAMERLGPNPIDDVEAARLGLSATSLLATGRRPEAMSTARAALARRPGDPLLLELVGDCQTADAQWSDAVQSYRRALSGVARGTASKGQMARLYRKVGESFAGSGDGARAFDAYRQSLSLVPGDPITRERLREITQGLR
jgi:tetratricopeptide (TPR) repeat protein